jgi:hypothetical protein
MLSAKGFLKRLISPRLGRIVREARVRRSVTHLFGPKNIRLPANEAVVTCVVRNGEFYLDAFIAHYTRMGFRHIFILDNGSTDRTVSMARSYGNVSVCQSNLAIDGNQALLKRYLALHSSSGGWCLDADIDEFFDYPDSDAVPLGQFLSYLNTKRYTVVMTQLLDMFSDQPLELLAQGKQGCLKATYPYYDISEVTQTAYLGSSLAAQYANKNTLPAENIALCWGGLRKTLYGNNCLLTKHSLFRVSNTIDLFPHVHFVNGANIADVSCLMLHYKLTTDALATAYQNADRFVANSATYKAFIDFLTRQSSSGYQIKCDTAAEYRKADELAERGFLFVSHGYRRFAQAARDSQAVSTAACTR